MSKTKKEEDEKLSIQTKVECNDGVTRIYNGFMFGIIAEDVGSGCFDVNSIECTSIVLSALDSLLRPQQFNKTILHQKWFSEEGMLLEHYEIIKAYERKCKLRQEYNFRYNDIGHTRSSKKRAGQNLCCINDIYFHSESSSLSPFKLFYGIIDGETISMPNTFTADVYQKIIKDSINVFINEMKLIPDWYKLIQTRGGAQAELGKSMNIKVDNFKYWTEVYKEEYLLKFNEGNINVDEIKLRIQKYYFIVVELEKLIKVATEYKTNITYEMFNDYCAAKASLLATESTLKTIDNNDVFFF